MRSRLGHRVTKMEEEMMRVLWILLMLCVISVAGTSTASAKSIVGGAGSTQYTCTKLPGENPTCTCTGGLDCIMMCKSKVCKDGCDVLSCTPDGGSCTCDWQQSAKPTNWKFQIAPMQKRVVPLSPR